MLSWPFAAKAAASRPLVDDEPAAVTAVALLPKKPEVVGAHDGRLTPAYASLLVESLKDARMPLRGRGAHIVILAAIVSLMITSVASARTATVHWYWWNKNIKFAWLPGMSDGFTSYYRMEVWTRTGCRSGIYVTLNEYNSRKQIVGDTNAAVSHLPAHTTAILKFPSFSDAARMANVAEIDCFRY